MFTEVRRFTFSLLLPTTSITRTSFLGLCLLILIGGFSHLGYAQLTSFSVEDSVTASKIAEGYTATPDKKNIIAYEAYDDSTIYIKNIKPKSSNGYTKLTAGQFNLVWDIVVNEKMKVGEPSDRIRVGYEGGELVFGFTQTLNFYFAVASGLFLLVGLPLLVWLWWRLSEERRRKRQAMLSKKYLAQGQEKERRRLAQEIHDGPVQDLHGLHLLADAASNGNEILDQITDIIDKLRAISTNLFPPALKQYGLAAALRSHGDRILERHDSLEIEMDLAEIEEDLSKEISLAFFRVGQEAINNAVQHGKADLISVDLSQNSDHLVLNVTDDGCGFSPPDDWHDFAGEDQFGLLGMRDRAESIGASIQIESQPGEGTKVTLEHTLSGELSQLLQPKSPLLGTS